LSNQPISLQTLLFTTLIYANYEAQRVSKKLKNLQKIGLEVKINDNHKKSYS